MDLSKEDVWLNLNKPEGYSSAKVVAIVKKLTQAKKVGHGGTLDPFANGVLPIALNKATKTSDQLMAARKKYFFRIAWGEFRDTDDVEGKVVETSDYRPNATEIISILPAFIGLIQQTPSKFSAIKIDGKRAYELARKGVEFEIKTREVMIYSLKLLTCNTDFADFEVDCSKGTYVRSLARDICNKITKQHYRTCGYVIKLTRLAVGSFRQEKTIYLDLLKAQFTQIRHLPDGCCFLVAEVKNMQV